MEHNLLFSDDYLHSRWEPDFRQYLESGEDDRLLDRLRKWNERDKTRTEAQLEAQFDHIFFREIWNYWGTGEQGEDSGYCLNPQFAVPGAGQTGGTGAADLALGWWDKDGVPAIPQVLCEFKDIRSGLDTPQKRKDNDRSPVKQCFDYLKYAFDATDSHSTLTPNWGIVTDMNEFRLYLRRVGDSHYQRFFIKSPAGCDISLIDDGEEPAFQRFLFWKIFQCEMMLANFGKSGLEKIIEDQWVHEKELEKGFYKEYQSYRESVYQAIIAANPNFDGTRGTLVKLTQRFLDRCIFILFCEDMGKALDFPNDLLRDMLARESTSPNYSPDFSNIWDMVKQLFRAMRDGGPFPPDHKINRFNGGLFEELPELEAICIPNHVFCAKGQGESAETLATDKNTLLYLSANYNFGTHGADHQRTITLYALGRIFEQSITDLEYMEAEADGKETLATVNKRKRDGVYYTPEWVTGYIVKETVGARLADIRAEIGIELGEMLPEKDINDYRRFLTSKRRKRIPDNKATHLIHALDKYEKELNNVKVLDPACGSGAFLIQALQFLLMERRTIADERARIEGTESLFDNDANIRSILSNNLYGVDINPESVEITQLALWLNTALPGKPLSNLDSHIRCGNSLVGPDFNDFYNRKHPDTLFNDLGAQVQESVNVFDWIEAFPEALGLDIPVSERGFDCVIGNPPYVKLQNFRKMKKDESDYYIEAKASDGESRYESTQTGNFDLYLPFIEMGISLLSPKGRMGYIAPSLWLKNEYGIGLRQKIMRLHSLDRLIDFKSYQVFKEAITYTALQFFSGSPNDTVRFYLAPDGDISHVDWQKSVEIASYSTFDKCSSWNMVPHDSMQLINRLSNTFPKLCDAKVTCAIYQGIKTGCDEAFVVNIQDCGQNFGNGSIVVPLASGALVKRYCAIAPKECLLFPYDVSCSGPNLISDVTMESSFPAVFKHLKEHKKVLTSREHGRFDDECWYCFSRPQNLERMRKPKLLIAGTAPGLRVSCDESGSLTFLGGRVYGIEPANPDNLLYLYGLLNSPLLNHIFKELARPKVGGFYDIETQFLAPLPIPNASSKIRKEIGSMARHLEVLHTEHRDKIVFVQRRLNAEQCSDNIQTEDCLWADVKSMAEWKTEAPNMLSAREKTSWAKDKREHYLTLRLDKIEAVLKPGISLSVEDNAGEVCLIGAGFTLASIVTDENEAPFIAAQWRHITRSTNITERFKAKKLVKALLSLRRSDNAALRKQVIKLDSEILDLDSKIADAEAEMNALVYRLYKLTDDEIRLVEAG